MTVSIAVEFLDAGRVGPPLEARGEPLQVTGRLAFARGSLTQEGRTVALWSGVCRHVARASRWDLSGRTGRRFACARRERSGYANRVTSNICVAGCTCSLASRASTRSLMRGSAERLVIFQKALPPGELRAA